MLLQIRRSEIVKDYQTKTIKPGRSNKDELNKSECFLFYFIKVSINYIHLVIYSYLFTYIIPASKENFLLTRKVFTYEKSFYLQEKCLLTRKVFTYEKSVYLREKFLLTRKVFTYEKSVYLRETCLFTIKCLFTINLPIYDFKP